MRAILEANKDKYVDINVMAECQKGNFYVITIAHFKRLDGDTADRQGDRADTDRRMVEIKKVMK